MAGIIIRAPSSATSSSPLFLRCVLSWHANNVSDGTNLCGRRDSLHLIIVRRPGRGLTEFRNMDSKDSDGSDSDMERHGYMAFNLAEGNLITRPKPDDNPSDLSPCDEDATCLDKDSSLEGDHLTGVVDRMMQEISPKDSSNDMGNLATGIVDRIMADVSKEGGDSSVMRRPPSLFESTPIASDSAEEQHSPILSHMSRRPPSGPFVMGDQMDIMTEVFAGRIPEHTGSSLTGTFYPEHLPLHASAGQEQHPVVSQMLMEKIKWIQRNPEQGNSSLKKLMDYQTPSSRSMSRQQKVRTDLALREKVRLINMSETTGKSQRSLAAEFHISVGSVNNILRRKREYLEAFEKNEVPSTCKSFRFTRPPKRSGYDELHTLILKWIEKVKGKMKPLTWPIIIEKSREFAVKLNILNFNSSGLWVENLKRSIDIAVPLPEQSNMSDSDVKLLSMWRKMLPFLQQGYEPENIFTISETALYYKCLPDKCFITGATCKGCHHHSDVLENRLTILLCCNALGERLKPLVVSRHGSPASLSNIRMSDLPVGWCHQPNANMTAEIFASWLRGLDTAMGQQKRHIALFMDMTPSHLASTLLKNISLKFYLDDSSHLLQPLNQGVIQTLKAIYRRRLLQSILARTCSTDDCLSALEAVSELDAVFWIHEAWRNINSEIITTCFQAAAFPENKSSCSLDKSPVNLEFIPEDLPQLIEEIGQTFKFMPMSADIYSQFDSQLPCHQGDGEEWETTLLAETTGRNIKSEPDESSEIAAIGPLRPSVDDMGVLPEISPFEAMECLSKLKRFSSSNMGLLTTVFELESLLLDSMCPSQHATLQFQQSSYPGFSVAFPPFSSDLQ